VFHPLQTGKINCIKILRVDGEGFVPLQEMRSNRLPVLRVF
jgi:hypothetical protein